MFNSHFIYWWYIYEYKYLFLFFYVWGRKMYIDLLCDGIWFKLKNMRHFLQFNKYIRLNSRNRPAPAGSHRTDWNSRMCRNVAWAPECQLVRLVLLPNRNRETDVRSIDCTAYSMALAHTYRTVRRYAIWSSRLNGNSLNVHLLMTPHADVHVCFFLCLMRGGGGKHQSEIIDKTNILF